MSYHHGKYRTKEHVSWTSMKTRCNNRNSKSWRRYGGRGIKVCKRWNLFQNFFEDMGAAPIGTSLDRINNMKGYYKSNCRWASVSVQCRNRTSNVNITFRGKTQCLRDWANEIGINSQTLRGRIVKFGWTPERALISPPGASRSNERILHHDGKSMSLWRWAKTVGLNAQTIGARLDKYGWTVAEALSIPSRPKLPNGQGSRYRGKK